MTKPAKTEGGGAARPKRHMKGRIVAAGVAALSAVALFAGCTSNVRQAGPDRPSDGSQTAHPYQDDQQALDSLALGDAEAFVTSRLGEPRQSLDLCSEAGICRPTPAHRPVLNVYRHENYTVRAVFDGNKMEFYAVTRESEQFKPHLKMPFDWGELGEFTYAQASGIAPDDLDAFHRRYPSYAEVKSLGAPNFQGIVLGYSPDGHGDERSWDVEMAQILDGALASSKEPKERVAARSPSGRPQGLIPRAFSILTAMSGACCKVGRTRGKS